MLLQLAQLHQNMCMRQYLRALNSRAEMKRNLNRRINPVFELHCNAAIGWNLLVEVRVVLRRCLT